MAKPVVPKLPSSTKWNSRKELSSVIDNNLPLRRPKIAIFASPEAESVRDSIDIEDERFLKDAEIVTAVQNDDCIGLDIELKECRRFQREQKTAWQSDQDGKSNQQQSLSNVRWKKATISAKLCVDFAKKKTSNSLKSDRKDLIPDEKDATSDPPQNRRRWRKVGLCASSNAMLLKGGRNAEQEKKTEQISISSDDPSVQTARNSNSLNIAGSDVADTKLSGQRTIPSAHRFGRLLAPQVSKSLPDKFQPSPPPNMPKKSMRRRTQSDSHALLPHAPRPFRRISSPALSSRSSSPASSACSSPILCRRKLSLALDSHSTHKPNISDRSPPNSPPSSTCSSPRSERRTLSMASDLETNRSIVEDLRHQRSEAISHLSNEPSLRGACTNDVGRHQTQAWEYLKGHEDKEDTALTEYFDIRSGSTSPLSLKQLKQTSNFNFPELVCLESDSNSDYKSSTSSSEDNTTESSESVVSLRTSNTHKTNSCKRTDAEIVKDVEEEIQQRVSRRKQQLIQQSGGHEYHSRLQQRARARSTGGQLRRALSDMTQKRTTAELWQIAVEKSKLHRDHFSNARNRVLSVH